MILLDGQKISEKIQNTLQEKIRVMGGGNRFKLVVILVGNNPASMTYVAMKKKKCLEMGINCEIVRLDKNISEQDFITKIETFNKDKTVTGILVQLPLPKNINARKILNAVSVKKDVDGLNGYCLGKIFLNQEEIIPCTPKGVIKLLTEYNIGIAGKNICVISFSDLVGKPLAAMCLNRGATVTVCHKKTSNLKQHTLHADIVITAAGVPGLITKDMVKKGVIIVDIGMTKVNKKMVGDVDFNNVKDVCSYITPVPYGVGPMTIISLIENLIKLRLFSIKNRSN